MQAVKQSVRKLSKVKIQVPERNFATYKSSTGLVGLEVDPDGLNTVHKLSLQVLENVKKIPESSYYRTSVEKWFKFIAKTVSSTTDVKAAEDEMGLGQIEEVAEIARDELDLIEVYFENKVWERVEYAKKHADEIAAEMADVIEFTSPKDPPQPNASTK